MPLKDGQYSKLANGHVKDITLQVSMPSAPSASVPADAPSLDKILNDLSKPGVSGLSNMNFAKVLSTFDDKGFWSDSYHWQGGKGPDDGSAYMANAQAQFMRFTSTSASTLGVPSPDLNTLSMSKVFSTGAKVDCALTLLSGQLSFQLGCH